VSKNKSNYVCPYICILQTHQSHVNLEKNNSSSRNSLALSHANAHGSTLAWLPHGSHAPFSVKLTYMVIIERVALNQFSLKNNDSI